MRSLLLLVLAATSLAAADWKAPRTAWGDPDLQGTWTNETITPFVCD